MMNNDNYLTINEELGKMVQMTTRTLRNRIVELKQSYPSLIRGGYRTRYEFHPSLLPWVAKRSYGSARATYPERRKKGERWVATTTFPHIQWNFFVGISPVEDLDEHVLISLLEGFRAFWVIHRINEINHMHVALLTNLPQTKLVYHLEKRLKEFSPRTRVAIAPFDPLLQTDCLSYLLRRGKHSEEHIPEQQRQRVLDWGLVGW